MPGGRRIGEVRPYGVFKGNEIHWATPGEMSKDCLDARGWAYCCQDRLDCRLGGEIALDTGEVLGTRWDGEMDERDALDELVRAHADLERLTGEITDARERQRRAAGRLVEIGRGTTWIAAQLGVTKQAVDGFLKYKERKATPPRPPTGSSI